MKCEFCGVDHLPVTKYMCKGIYEDDVEIYQVVHMCVCCDANTDKEWLAEQLGWDEVVEMKAI